jgi:hypothetical protein
MFEPRCFVRSEVIDGDTKGRIVEITLDSEDSGSIYTKVPVDADIKLGSSDLCLESLLRAR